MEKFGTRSFEVKEILSGQHFFAIDLAELFANNAYLWIADSIISGAFREVRKKN